MPKSLIDAYRSFVRNRVAQLEHDRAMSDPRFATEHHMAIERSLDSGTGGCPFCT